MSTLTNVADGIDLSKPAYTYTGFQFVELLKSIHVASPIPSPSPQEQKKRWLTKKETCAYINLSMVTLDGLIKKGKLKSYRPSPDRLLFSVEELDEYVLSTKAI